MHIATSAKKNLSLQHSAVLHFIAEHLYSFYSVMSH